MGLQLTPSLRGFILEEASERKLVFFDRENVQQLPLPAKKDALGGIWELEPDTIVATLSSELPDIATRVQVIHELVRSGILEDEVCEISRFESAFWQSQEIDGATLHRILGDNPVCLSGEFTAGRKELENALRNAGFHFDRAGKIGIADLRQLPFSENWMDSYGDHERILFVQLDGSNPYIGPLLELQPGPGPCPICLKHPLEVNSRSAELFRAMTGTTGVLPYPLTFHPLAVQQAVATVVFELIKFLYYGSNAKIERNLLEIDPLSGERTFHAVRKRPQCPHCGDPNLSIRPPQPITIRQQGIADNVGGGYRIVSAEETFQRYRKHISSITGVVQFIRNYRNFDSSLIHNYASGRNMALRSSSVFWSKLHLKSDSGGKGRDTTQARTGALAEAIERYSATYQGPTCTVNDSFRTLAGAVHPNDCLLFSERQFAQRERTMSDSPLFYGLVPIPFDDAATMEWTPVYSLTENSFKYLPTCFCYAQYPAEDEQRMYAYPDSNGCAAGNTLEEAILQGFLELVERDSAAIWWYNRLRRPGVDLASAGNPYIDQVVQYYQQIGRKIHVLDLTSDLGIPAFASISYRPHASSGEEVIYAFGCHVDVNIALERAIVELNQLLPLTQTKGGDYKVDDPYFVQWLREVRVSEEAWLAPAGGAVRNVQTDFAPVCEKTIHDAIQFCISSAKRQGLETLVLNLTQLDIGMPVAKVIVPGLRHFWRRTAPGRLYDVPVKMGWRKERLCEAALNPWSIFI
ncbi:MAG: TOMM precursor leader peptide-binding protein [Bacteroidota bacterium]